jgi:hypothetical protein
MRTDPLCDRRRGWGVWHRPPLPSQIWTQKFALPVVQSVRVQPRARFDGSYVASMQAKGRRRVLAVGSRAGSVPGNSAASSLLLVHVGVHAAVLAESRSMARADFTQAQRGLRGVWPADDGEFVISVRGGGSKVGKCLSCSMCHSSIEAKCRRSGGGYLSRTRYDRAGARWATPHRSAGRAGHA